MNIWSLFSADRYKFDPFPANIYLFKRNNRSTKKRCEICSKLTHTLIFISNTFISNARLKLEKNQANAKQHPEAELFLFEKYSVFSSTLLSKNRIYSKNKQKNDCLFHDILQLIMMKMKMKMKNKS